MEISKDDAVINYSKAQNISSLTHRKEGEKQPLHFVSITSAAF